MCNSSVSISLHSVLGKMHHPFGKEEAASQKQLLGFFCECLQRGDWELAKACVPQLHEAQGDIPKKVEDILRVLVLCPNQLRCEQDISPQRLACVWLLVLEKWLALEKKLLPAGFQRKLEFLLLSEDLPGDISEDILKVRDSPSCLPRGAVIQEAQLSQIQQKQAFRMLAVHFSQARPGGGPLKEI